MLTDVTALVAVYATLFVVIDPVGLTPIFVALTQGMSAERRRAIAVRACLIAVIILTLFGLFGVAVLEFVGISMPAFRIAGGVLLFLTALDMLFERRTKRREDQMDERPDPSVFPLALPLIAGPGAIATMILLGGRVGNLAGSSGDTSGDAGVGSFGFCAFSWRRACWSASWARPGSMWLPAFSACYWPRFRCNLSWTGYRASRLAAQRCNSAGRVPMSVAEVEMDTNSLMQLFYLVLLGAAVTGWFIAQNRQNMGKTAQHAVVWVLIFVGFIAAVGLWSDIRDDVAPRQSVISDGAAIEVPQSFDGHYYLTLQINDKPVRFVVDTGASEVVLTRADAARVGIDTSALAFIGSANTANGAVPIAPVRLGRVELGEFVDLGVRASVNGGEMRESLLGMTYLQRFERIEISDGMLILHR